MIWDHRSGALVGRYSSTAAIQAIGFSPDGTKLALCSEIGELKILQTDGSVFLSHRLQDPAHCIAIDGRRVVLGKKQSSFSFLTRNIC